MFNLWKDDFSISPYTEIETYCKFRCSAVLNLYLVPSNHHVLLFSTFSWHGGHSFRFPDGIQKYVNFDGRMGNHLAHKHFTNERLLWNIHGNHHAATHIISNSKNGISFSNAALLGWGEYPSCIGWRGSFQLEVAVARYFKNQFSFSARLWHVRIQLDDKARGTAIIQN